MSNMLTGIRNRLRIARAVYRILAQWRREKARVQPDSPVTGSVRRLLVLPCDPWTLNGSRGDEAMITALIERLRAENPGVEVSIVTATPEASEWADRFGCRALLLWQDPWSMKAVVDAFAGMDLVLVVGADVMDGYYCPTTALRLWTLADLAARRGCRSIVTGCSFNLHPSRYLRWALDSLDPRVEINLRDPISFARFSAFTRARAKLVADAAFLLVADEDSRLLLGVRAFAASQHSAGRRVLGFNMHPMLIKNISEGDLSHLVCQAQLALRRVLQDDSVALLLISHDYRGRDSDATCLSPLCEQLKAEFPQRVHFPEAVLNARELKAVAGLADVVVTGRMHLAIAALGRGRPVAALTYQDKFQGLFQHFGLPHWLLLDPKRLQSEELALVMERLLLEQGALQEMVQAQLPQVNKLSWRNLEAGTPA